MMCLEVCFWLSALGVAYVSIGYPLLVAVAARMFGRALQRGGRLPRSLSLVISAHNAEIAIVRRLKELKDRLSSADIPGGIFVVSDGSAAGTAAPSRA